LINVIDGNVKLLKWENTNKLLNDNWIGIKTGFNIKSGPCVVCAN
jgi:D-alanyl-D-alanine carboxypeptidase